MGDIVTLTGPSGAGKTTLAGELIRLWPERFKMVVSITTREPRTGARADLPGEYMCVSRDDFLFLECRYLFLWTKFVHGNFYGTLSESVDKALEASHAPLMILTIDAVEDLKRFVGDRMRPFYIHRPEILIRESLEGKESPEIIARRMADCRDWLERSKRSSIEFQYILNNGSVAELVRRFFNIHRMHQK